MIVLFYIFILEISFIFHVYYLISFLSKKRDRDFKGFLVTTVTNVFIGIFIAIFLLINPREIGEIYLERIIFIESGIIFFIMLYIKGRVTYRIYKRLQEPEHFHYSYFGKKVIHKSAVTSRDLFAYFLTLPLTLICGAYLIVQLGCGR